MGGEWGVSQRGPLAIPSTRAASWGGESLEDGEGCLPPGEATAKGTEDGECGQGWGGGWAEATPGCHLSAKELLG